MSNENQLPDRIQSALSQGVEEVLFAAVEYFGCQAGTVHWLNPEGALSLAAHKNLPPPIVEIVKTVPIGKGVAGLAAEKREPISICNLQSDTSGRARPAARATGMEGSIAVPMLLEGELFGVLGIAKVEAHDWTDDEKALLLRIASALASLRP
jgi:L-methionine (R)-S-oxide reductase